ncbi:MAG: RelA/SpoT domain-containing protein [Deltaproteobacteria bacterium]|nr:RelA/SpoT domain-containing protein [Deltaproteobacteria bacterium]
MNEAEIISRWEADKLTYSAWAKFVLDQIYSSVKSAIHPQKIEEFLKIPAIPRLKETKSLVDKALFRNKNYQDPYSDITDKVGVRFVVLLTSDIKKVEKAICGSSDWTSSKDRDYEEERRERPLEFTYQSVHYIVRASRDLSIYETMIPQGTPCEIQVRTLLQHAHSELTHDSIYKPRRAASVEIQRTVAKSMALIEATDDFFERVMEDLGKASEAERKVLTVLERLYAEHVKSIPEGQKSNLLIIDAFSDKSGEDIEGRLNELLRSKPFIVDRVIERAVHEHFYRQPAILLAYLMASSSPSLAKEKWPLTLDELRPVYMDLGLSIDDY